MQPGLPGYTRADPTQLGKKLVNGVTETWGFPWQSKTNFPNSLIMLGVKVLSGILQGSMEPFKILKGLKEDNPSRE